LLVVSFSILLYLPGNGRAGALPGAEQQFRVYSHLLDPTEHPDFNRRSVRPPTWATFDGRTRFTVLRGFEVQDGKIVNYKKALDKFTRANQLGDVIWPSYPILFAQNLGDLADEINHRNLYLFDIWGFVPGSGPGGYWQQFTPPKGVFELLKSKLGARWLGMDVGEQDGRYIGGYANQMYPVSRSRFAQYVNFQRHFERMCDSLGNRMVALVSLNYGHYLLKEGVFSLIGAETAQALPNAQVYYAFIRGAGKQYGVPWFGNASVWNRWGWKSYGGTGPNNGPTKGTSVNLLKRLLYSQILYNSVCVGFENSWFDGAALSPVGRVQQAARKWVLKNGQPGAMVTPIAVLLDFYSGWTFPRHLYTSDVYRVWGNLPYEAGDYWTDDVLDLLYPGYQDSSYFHDESGFIVPTPHGDAADCVLSDAPGWLLERYPVLVVAGKLRGGAEIRDKLLAYAQGGGRLVITAGSLAQLPGGLAGIEVTGTPRQFDAGQEIRFDDVMIKEDRPFELRPMTVPNSVQVTARCGDVPAVVSAKCGGGRVIVLASTFGVGTRPATEGAIRGVVDKPLVTPFPLLQHVRRVLDDTFAAQRLFEAGAKLSLITCRQSPGEYTLGICNNALVPQPLTIVSRCGEIESIRELEIDQFEKNAAGYLPEGSAKAAIGVSQDGVIAGGDVRIFRVKVRERGVTEITHRVPPPRPEGRVLPLRGITSIHEAIMARPTFFQHFDGVMIDWRYLHDRETDAVAREAGWIKRQSLRIVTDLTSGINLYPDLRLIDNIRQDHEASMAAVDDVLYKMAILGSRDLVLSLHRQPENNFSRQQTWDSFTSTLRRICQAAAKKEITVHLRFCARKPPSGLKESLDFLRRVAQPNLRLAPSVELLLAGGEQPARIVRQLKGHVGLWMVGAATRDVQGRIWSVHAPIASATNLDQLAEMLGATPNVPIVLDAVYEDRDAEYLDIRALHERLAARPRAR